MTFKKMKPEDFKVGRKYRNDHPNFCQYTYEMVENHPKYNAGPVLLREKGHVVLSGTLVRENLWEEVGQKKRKFF